MLNPQEKGLYNVCDFTQLGHSRVCTQSDSGLGVLLKVTCAHLTLLPPPPCVLPA